MPELPEVETIKLGLQKYLIGHKILDVEIKAPKIFQGDKKNIVGGKVIDVLRAGKGLIIELDNGYILAIHLKLTGQIIYKDEKVSEVSNVRVGTLPNKFTRIIFKLDKAANLFYNDIRKFGWMKIVKKEDLKNLPFFKEMGPDPFKDLTLGLLKTITSKTNLPIKLLLMDQKKIGGVGNIYANEALFEAKIDPRRKAKSLNDSEIKKLYNAILKVLKKGIKYGGASDVNFVNAIGKDGKYQEHFLVYRRKGGKCFSCKGVVEKITLGGRGTYFCSICQK